MTPDSQFRPISPEEVEQLRAHGCRVDSPESLQVPAEGFNPSHYANTRFSGRVTLGVTSGNDQGIYNSSIINYTIGDNVLIENSRLEATLESTFGVGCAVNVLNETGGRDVLLHPGLSSQIAYIMAIYRHRKELLEEIRRVIRADADLLRGTPGTVADGASILDCHEIRDVNVGPGALLRGCGRLIDGTVSSAPEAPAFMGTGVVARHFMVSTDSIVDSHSIIDKVFVGQGTEIAAGFSAHDSLFFSNCMCHGGEAASLFAGPYTVSMHKSTLLIGLMVSFFNAGSGSNQSNHAYKLGARHQGILPRGCKLASNSYLMLPAVLGPFSTLVGYCDSHPDTTTLPFSYLFCEKGETNVSGGTTLRSIGTTRDAWKWGNRDRRSGEVDRLDVVNSDILSPYTVSMMTKWFDRHSSTRGAGFNLSDYARRKTRDYYKRAIARYVGNSLIPVLSAREITDAALVENLLIANAAEDTAWLDVAGLLITADRLESILGEVERGLFPSVHSLNMAFHHAADCYYADSALYASSLINAYYSNIDEPLQRMISAIDDAIQALSLDFETLDDAMKEYGELASRGYKVHKSSELELYTAVHGDPDDDPTIVKLRATIADRSGKLQSILANLKQLKALRDEMPLANIDDQYYTDPII